jgi:hypothetical protein
MGVKLGLLLYGKRRLGWRKCEHRVQRRIFRTKKKRQEAVENCIMTNVIICTLRQTLP